ncbi:hypothetical protein KBB96_00360 [Luteolibacter ambystomatis]|uniref:Uncharacterized protein n=1 Tax=Luteolibacter ambystomatis TaxID=2824561 RepID=A0A975G9J9_9BACT|nr:hypothetical protein [Luteolibacter ambystomatis]QUE51367.1 hypothetical protein KBB96_00360 [Luteolibacter ambystomatis]
MSRARKIFRLALFSIGAVVLGFALFSEGYKRGYLDCWETPLRRSVYSVTWRAVDAETSQPLHAWIDWGSLQEKGAASHGYEVLHADGSTTSLIFRERTAPEVSAAIVAPGYASAPIQAISPETPMVTETMVVKLHPELPNQ